MNQEPTTCSSPTWQNLRCRHSSLAVWEGVSWGTWLGAGSPPGAQGPGLCFHPLGSQLLVYCLVGLKGLVFLGLAAATPWVNMWEWENSRRGARGERMRLPVPRVLLAPSGGDRQPCLGDAQIV